MEETEKLKDILEKFEAELSANKAAGGDYCVIVYARHSMQSVHGCKTVKFIYKNIADFESRVLEDIKKIDPMFSVDFQIWFFD
jgi:hypothetical protein